MQQFKQSSANTPAQRSVQDLINRVLTIRDRNFRRFQEQQRVSELISQFKRSRSR